MDEGKLLGHIVSFDGIKISLERVQFIQHINLARHKKGIQSFMGKIHFLRRFIPNFLEILKPVSDMLKKDTYIK